MRQKRKIKFSTFSALLFPVETDKIRNPGATTKSSRRILWTFEWLMLYFN